MASLAYTEQYMNEIGKKDDKGKPDVSLIYPDFILGIARVLTYGADKYGRNNWKKLSEPWPRYYAAAQRHLLARQMGEEEDTESGYSHLLHAACNLMFLYYIERCGCVNANSKE